ncbi:MAG: hypothetical protein M3343_11710 [Actinomycetota bacterium]|nr:hypothetical protein [Actinomycetota bacterium]
MVIPVLVVAIVALTVLAWVALPLRRGPRSDAPLPSLELEEAEADKRSALVAIVDIENEHAVGKLSRPDLDALKAEYEARALEALRRAEALREEQPLSASGGEADQRSSRRSRQEDQGSSRRSRQEEWLDDDELELEIAAIRERLRCPSCGAARAPGESCDRCGA